MFQLIAQKLKSLYGVIVSNFKFNAFSRLF